MLLNQEIFTTLIAEIAVDNLSRANFRKILKNRKLFLPRLRILLSKMDAASKSVMSELVCRHTIKHHKASKFTPYLNKLNEIALENGSEEKASEIATLPSG